MNEDIKDFKLGPNVRKLMIHIFSKDVRSLADGINQIKNVQTTLPQAVRETKRYIETVRSASDANPNWTDEDIAGMILVGIEERVRNAKATI